MLSYSEQSPNMGDKVSSESGFCSTEGAGIVFTIKESLMNSALASTHSSQAESQARPGERTVMDRMLNISF